MTPDQRIVNYANQIAALEKRLETAINLNAEHNRHIIKLAGDLRQTDSYLAAAVKALKKIEPPEIAPQSWFDCVVQMKHIARAAIEAIPAEIRSRLKEI